MAALPVLPPESIAVANSSQQLAVQALAVRVTCNEERAAAAEMGRAIAAMEKEVGAAFDPIVDAAHKAHKIAVAKRAEVLEPLTRAKRFLAGCIGGYDQEQERIRRVEEERLRREQREREAAEAVRLRKEAEDRALAEAQWAVELGDRDLAEAILDAPVVVEAPAPVPVIVPSAVQRTQGVAARTTWKFRIENEALIPREYLMADEKKIGGIVRAMKGATRIPGVVAYEEAGVSFRS